MGRPKGSKNKELRLNEVTFSEDLAIIVINSQKYGDKKCIVDREDYERVNFTRWQVIKRGSVFHVQSCSDHNIYIHRIILKDAELVDHINGDGLDNRKVNLRSANKRLNAQNSRVNPERSLPKGVSRSSNGNFFSRIKVEGNQLYLGSFKTDKEAAQAYNNAALLHFGEYARLNQIDSNKSNPI